MVFCQGPLLNVGRSSTVAVARVTNGAMTETMSSVLGAWMENPRRARRLGGLTLAEPQPIDEEAAKIHPGADAR